MTFLRLPSIILRRLLISVLTVATWLCFFGVHKYLVIPIVICCNIVNVTAAARCSAYFKN
jgi:hypothetical protein